MNKQRYIGFFLAIIFTFTLMPVISVQAADTVVNPGVTVSNAVSYTDSLDFNIHEGGVSPYESERYNIKWGQGKTYYCNNPATITFDDSVEDRSITLYYYYQDTEMGTQTGYTLDTTTKLKEGIYFFYVFNSPLASRTGKKSFEEHSIPFYVVVGNPKIKKLPSPKVITTAAVKNVAVKDNLNLYGGDLPALQTVVNANGGISVMDTLNCIVYEYDKNEKFIKTVELPIAIKYGKVGAFTKDSDGNYYVVYGITVSEDEKNEKNLALIKYSSEGVKINEFWIEAEQGGYNGIRVPFDAGTCRIEISGDMIAVYLAKEQFKWADGQNHQSDFGFILNRNSFEDITESLGGAPYVSHSFNQFILPIDNGFVFVGHGDASPRAFSFQKRTLQGSADNSSFLFRGLSGNNFTYASLGGLAKTSTGYIFAGSYRKSENDIERNLFIQTISEDFTVVSDPFWLSQGNIPWTSNSLSIVQIDTDKYLISGGGSMAVIDAKGKYLAEPVDFGSQGTLHVNDVLRYNSVTKRVYGARTYVASEVSLYSFDPFQLLSPNLTAITAPANAKPVTAAPTAPPATQAPTTKAPTPTAPPATQAPTIKTPTPTAPPATQAPTAKTQTPTAPPVTQAPTTKAPEPTVPPTTQQPTVPATEAPTSPTTVEITTEPTEETTGEVAGESSDNSTTVQSNELTDDTTEAAEAVFAPIDESSETTQLESAEQEPANDSPSVWIFILIGVGVIGIAAGGIILLKKNIKQK